MSIKRLQELHTVLKNASVLNCDFVVFPEASIPFNWLPAVASFSRKHQIAIIFGAEHRVVGNSAWNLIFELIPHVSPKGYRNSVVIPRLKNHYAPREIELMRTFRLHAPRDHDNNYYHRVSWRGFSFTTYNCFELANISHRAIFKSKIDILFACVWNRDTNYYKHILDSAVRDLHCYTVQVNTAQYGGSCILQPTSTVTSTKLSLKGGLDTSLLTSILDIEYLQKFHHQSIPLNNDIFKPLPPGFIYR